MTPSTPLHHPLDAIYRVPHTRGPDSAAVVRKLDAPGMHVRLSSIKPPANEMLVQTRDNIYYCMRSSCDNTVVDTDALRTGDLSRAVIPTWGVVFPAVTIGRQWRIPRQKTEKADPIITSQVLQAVVLLQPQAEISVPGMNQYPISPFIATEGLQKIIKHHRERRATRLNPDDIKKLADTAFLDLFSFFWEGPSWQPL